MDNIEDCFVKFFLKQAQEIESDTIIALMNHGYRTKLSLTAMDLDRDLPLIEEISLAQRSLLRRYLFALQENQPFQVILTKDPPTGNIDFENGIPIKKRKYDIYIADQSSSTVHSNLNNDDNNDNVGVNEFNTTFESLSPNKRVYDSIVNKINKRKSYLELPTTEAILVADQRNRNTNRFSTVKSAESADVQMSTGLDDTVVGQQMINDQEMNEIDESSNVSIRKRGRKAAAAATQRTPSQIRYEKIKQSLAAINQANNDNVNVSPPAAAAATAAEDHTKTTTRRSSKFQVKNESTNDDITNKNNRKSMTPAEREMLARIEAKKAAAANKANKRNVRKY